MNIDELKNAWGEYDKSLEGTINLKLLKTVSVSKTKSLTNTYRFGAIIEIIVSIWFCNIMAGIAAEHISTWQYWVPAVVIGLFSLGTVIWNAYTLIQIGLLHFDESIAAMQKKLERIHSENNWRQSTLQYLTLPLVMAMLAIMALKYLNLSLTSHLDVVLYAIIGGIVIIPFIAWIVKMFPDKEMQSAIDFLKEIKKFEKEV